jgi:heme exporter protein D
MSAFLSQGGYASFVWGAYGMVAALLVIEVIALRRQRRTILARLGRLMRLRSSGGEE